MLAMCFEKWTVDSYTTKLAVPVILTASLCLLLYTLFILHECKLLTFSLHPSLRKKPDGPL